MTTTIEIKRLRLFANHGVGAQERIVGNLFEVSIALKYPADAAGISDSVNDTLNYAEVIDVVKHEMAIPSNLLEHVASRIRSAILAKWPAIEGGMIRVAKLTPPCGVELEEVAATIEW